MSPTTAPADPGRWIPIRDRVTGRLLCEYDPTTGRIRVRRNRRYYYASVPLPPTERLPAAPVPSGTCPEGVPTQRDTCPEGIPSPWELIEAAHQLLHQPCPEGIAARGACPACPACPESNRGEPDRGEFNRGACPACPESNRGACPEPDRGEFNRGASPACPACPESNRGEPDRGESNRGACPEDPDDGDRPDP